MPPVCCDNATVADYTEKQSLPNVVAHVVHDGICGAGLALMSMRYSTLVAALLFVFEAGALADEAKTADTHIRNLKEKPAGIQRQENTVETVLQHDARSNNVVGTEALPGNATRGRETENVLKQETVNTKASSSPMQKGDAAAQSGQKARSTATASAVSKLPDERPLWRMLDQRRYAALLSRIEQLRGDFPGWHPPAKLATLVREGLVHERIERAAGTGDASGLVGVSHEHPEAFGCVHIDHAWALTVAHAKLGQIGEAEGIARGLLECPKEADRIATLYKAKDWLPASRWEALVEIEQRSARTPQGDEAFRQLRYDYRLELLVQASSRKEYDKAAGLFTTLSPEIDARKDAGAALLGAWAHYQLRQYKVAAPWFDRVLAWDPAREDARRGLALCAFQEKRYDIALREAEALPARAEGRRDLVRDILVAQAQAANAAGLHARSLELLYAARAQSTQPLPRHARLLSAWSHMELGRTDIAADEFAALYREGPDVESAQGALNALTRAGRDDDLRQLAQSEPLADMVHRYRADRAFADKYFLRARSLAPERFAALGAVAAPQATMYVATRSKSGDAGLSQMDLEWRPSIEAAFPAGSAGELRLRVDRISIGSGALPANAQVGSAPKANRGLSICQPGYVLLFIGQDLVQCVTLGFFNSRFFMQPLSSAGQAYAFEPTTRTQGWQPQITWSDERSHALEMSLGQTPSGGPVMPAWTGRIDFRQNDASTYWELSAYRDSVHESTLSYVGLRDPYGGGVWGRVLKTGVHAVARFRLTDGSSINTQFNAESLSGRQVESNTRISGEIGAAYDLRLPGFDYAVAGVDINFDQYSNNLSHFTMGHGGYFSPQHYWRAGPFLDFRTAENRPWIMRGRVSAGRASRREDAAPFFPLEPDGRMYDAVSGIGNAFDIEFSGTWRINDTMQFGMQVIKRHSPQYNDYAATGFLRILFEPRKSVLSSDLPANSAKSLF